MNDKAVDFWRISLRKPNSEEIEKISKYAVSYVFGKEVGDDPKALLLAISKEEEIKWLLRAVQSYNGRRESAIQHLIDVDGRTIGSVIVTREECDNKNHTGIFELYLQKEMIGRGIEIKIFEIVKGQILKKWNGKVKLLKAFCPSGEETPYRLCGFTKLGSMPIATLTSRGKYLEEAVLYRRLDQC